MTVYADKQCKNVTLSGRSNPVLASIIHSSSTEFSMNYRVNFESPIFLLLNTSDSKVNTTKNDQNFLFLNL